MTRELSASLLKIVNMLNDGDYHDGSTMGDALNMTRSAVWKTIKKLQSYGVAIHSVKGKGYALQQTPLILLDANKIQQKLAKDKIDISVFESIATTMDYFQQHKHHAGIKVVLAEQMTSGRGRFDREWHAPFGQNIYMSCQYPLQKDISEIAGLSLVVSLATLKTLQQFGLGQQVATKWPNDIVSEQKKLSGSLIEMRAQSHGHCQVVIGIGINANMLAADVPLQPWTSMRKVTGEYIDRNELTARLLQNLQLYLRRFERQGFACFMAEWMAADSLMQKKIKLKNVNTVMQGEVVGVNELGNLLLRLADGTVRAFASGDTTILK